MLLDLGRRKKSFWMDKWLGDTTIKDITGREKDEDIQCWEFWTNGSWDRFKIGRVITDESLKDRW